MSETNKTSKVKTMEPKVYATEARYIDPEGVDSIVGYSIHSPGTYMQAKVTIADCSHIITWYFDEETAIEKVDEVISILTNFRKEYIKAKTDFNKRMKLSEKV